MAGDKIWNVKLEILSCLISNVHQKPQFIVCKHTPLGGIKFGSIKYYQFESFGFSKSSNQKATMMALSTRITRLMFIITNFLYKPGDPTNST